MPKLKPTIAILTATLALAGCRQQYETVGECKLAELKNLDQPDENAALIVAEYCFDYFAKIYEEESSSETEESNRSVQLVTEPEWEEVWQTSGHVDWVNVNSIAEGPNLVRSADVKSAESEEKLESGDFEVSPWIFQCSRRFFRVKDGMEYNNRVPARKVSTSPLLQSVSAGTNGAKLYNFVCSYESPRNDPDLTAED